MPSQNLLVELFVEELPPKVLKKLGEALAEGIFNALEKHHLVLRAEMIDVKSFASPRRLGVFIPNVLHEAPARTVSQKLMPVNVGLDSSGQPTAALQKKMETLGVPLSKLQKLVMELREAPPQPAQGALADTAVARLHKQVDGKSESLFYAHVLPGATLQSGLQSALIDSLAKLPIPKVMTYQLADGWTDVRFVRPAHSLVALHGAEVVPVEALGLKAGNTTQGHRFEAALPLVTFEHADSYEATLEKDGAVIASFAARRAEIMRQLAAAAAAVGGGVRPIEDDALLDEVTGLVERPNVLVCEFESEFLEVPQECLILTMKANQKYFPLLDAQGRLTNKFLVVSNIRPHDASAVVGGNERVVRPRLADAKFFFDQDRKKTLTSRVAGLARVVYHNKLGTQGERTERVREIARAIAQMLGGGALTAQADQAAALAKADLVTDMVGEFPELQGTMGRYYAINDGMDAEVADAIEDHYKPRFAGDALPRGNAGVVVALADKLESLAGMFAVGQLPSGDKDPFALRRHALGVVRMLVERNLALEMGPLITLAFAQFGLAGEQAEHQLAEFIYERLSGTLREQGYSAQQVDAVLALRPQRLGEVSKRLAAVRAFAALPEAPALAAANKRIGNILKKADKADAHVSVVLLKEPAEQALYAALKEVGSKAGAQFEAGDYTGSLQTLAALRAPVDAFFDGVMVNAEEADLRLNRLGLLATLHAAMNRVADLARLAT